MRAFSLFFLLLTTGALAGEKEEIFARFDHKEHGPTFQRIKLTCLACHQVGGTGAADAAADDLDKAYLPPPRASCHECHAPGEGGLGDGEPFPHAPKRCDTCHTNVRPPETHGPGWREFHGVDATMSTATCRDCHERAWCADCHDRRDDATHRVHDNTWLTVHGIVARSQASSCDSCHIQAECTSCHASSAGYGRNK